MTENTYKPGTILMLEQGEYSSFCYCAGVVVLSEINFADEIESFNDAQRVLPEEDRADWTADCPDAFVVSLIVAGKVAPLDFETLHIGDSQRLGL